MSADFAHGHDAGDEYLLDQAAVVSDAPGSDETLPETLSIADHATGTQLRRRFVTSESIAELAETERPSLVNRLFRRK